MKPITNENYNLADSSIEYINIEYINAEEIRKKINDSLSPLIHETLAQYGYSKSRDDLEIKQIESYLAFKKLLNANRNLGFICQLEGYSDG